MTKLKFIFALFVFTTLSLACTAFTNAQTNNGEKVKPAQVFITARRGTDLNPCTRVAPCRGVARALEVVQTGGEIVLMSNGNYNSFTIDKAITVSVAAGVGAAMIVSTAGGAAINVNTKQATDTVILRGLTLSGQSAPMGIEVASGIRSLRVENCVFDGFNQVGVSFMAAGQLTLKDTTLKNNKLGVYAKSAKGKANVLFDHCQLENNAENSRADRNATINYRNSDPPAK